MRTTACCARDWSLCRTPVAVSAISVFSVPISHASTKLGMKWEFWKGGEVAMKKESSLVVRVLYCSCFQLVFGFLESPVNFGKLALIYSFYFVEEESDTFQITANQELSPFHIMASRKHPLSRTYSRKKLLS